MKGKYTLSPVFAKNLVTKLYYEGYYDDSLIVKLRSKTARKNDSITINGHKFRSKLAAANYYEVILADTLI